MDLPPKISRLLAENASSRFVGQQAHVAQENEEEPSSLLDYTDQIQSG